MDEDIAFPSPLTPVRLNITGIESIPSGALTNDPSIQTAAEFAIHDHNSKNPDTLVDLLRVKEAASQLLAVGGCLVYYLHLEIQRKLKHKWQNPPPFTVAIVCTPPTMKPSISTGFIHLIEYEMRSDDDGDHDDTNRVETIPLFNTLDSIRESHQLAANWCLIHHNEKHPHEFLQLLKILSCSCHITNDKYADSSNYYHLTLKVSNGQKARLVTTLATRSALWDDREAFECTPLVRLVDVPYPEWISLDLIELVGSLGLQHYHLFLPPNQSSPHPLIFFKNLDSLHQLLNIANQLGHEQTRDQLVPFLGANSDHVYPQVFGVIAEKFHSLIPCIGGAEHAHLLLPHLISLCVASPHALKSALQSFTAISLHTRDVDFSAMFIPFVIKMAISDSPLRRASSCAYFKLAYLHATSKQSLIKLYTELCKDRFPSVRGSAASHFADFTAAVRCDTLEGPDASDDSCFFSADDLYRTLVRDDNMHVRILAAKECPSLLRLGMDKEVLTDALISLSADPCVEVLVLIPSMLYELCVAKGFENVSQLRVLILGVITNLLSQSTTSVREEVAKELIRLCRFIGPQVPLISFLPFVKTMSSDSSDYVSAVSAWLLMHMLSVSRECLSREVLEVLNDLVVDGCLCAKLNIITRLDHVWDHLDQKSREILRATVNELAGGSSNMAIRVIVVYSPMLATIFGSEMFRELCVQRMKDKDVLVGKAAKKSLKFLATSLPYKEEIGLVQDLCFPQDLSQVIHFIYAAPASATASRR